MAGFCDKCQMSYDGNRCPISHKRSGSKTGMIVFGIIIIIGIGFLIYEQQIESNPNTIPDTISDIVPDIQSNLLDTKTIQQKIVNTVTPKPYNLYTYSVNPIPDIPDSTIPMKALAKSISSWEQNNPEIEFIESDSPHMTINWKLYGEKTHEGLASCTFYNNNNDPRDCVLDISLGNIDCNGNYNQWDVNGLSNIIMHEMGHAFGIGHSSNENHLMFGYGGEIFDDLGYSIPSKFDNNYVNQKAINQEYNILMNEYDSLNREINSMSDSNWIQKNQLIKQSNRIVEESNSMLEIINCFPNVG